MANESNVTSITVGAKIRKEKKKRDASAESPHEAYEPRVSALGADFIIAACDGEQHYVWLASKGKRKTFQVKEVYPGLAKKRTALRDATEAADLVLTGTYATLEDVQTALAEVLFEGFEACPTDAG